MATPLNTIKNWFKTGLKPTQTQFWAMFDSFWHKAEEIPTSSINGLDDTLDNKVDKASYDIEQQDVADALVTIGEDVSGKVDKVDGKGLSTNDFTDEAEQTVTDAEAHLNNNDIHVTADQKKTYANKLKAYVVGEVIEDVLGDVFRISDNKIYSLNAALPYTTNDIIAETVNGDWTIELEAPEAGLTFKDADGIDQFSGSFALFEGFGFDPATKKLINPVVVQEFFVKDLFEVGESGGTHVDPYKNRLRIRQINDINSNPPIFEINAQGKGSSNGHYAKIHLTVQNTVANSDTIVAEIAHNLFKLNTALEAPELNITGQITSITPQSSTILYAQGSGSDYSAILQEVTSPRKKLIFISKATAGGWNADIEFKIHTGATGGLITPIQIKSKGATSDIILKGDVQPQNIDFSQLGKYADDAAAGAAGIPINFAYINSATGAVHSRQS